VSVLLSGRLIRTYEELVQLYRRRIQASGYRSEVLFYSNQQQHELKLKAYARLIARLPPGDSILDIGCGYGELLRFATPTGYYLGIDLVADFVEEARRRYPAQQFAVVDAFNYSGPAVDWALLVGVLSSVPTPKALISMAAKVARKGLIFDITLGERLPSGYLDLFRWTLEEVEATARELDLVLSESLDGQATWMIFRAEPFACF
jgi:SAM-dependent methyltransferase